MYSSSPRKGPTSKKKGPGPDPGLVSWTLYRHRSFIEDNAKKLGTEGLLVEGRWGKIDVKRSINTLCYDRHIRSYLVWKVILQIRIYIYSFIYIIIYKFCHNPSVIESYECLSLPSLCRESLLMVVPGDSSLVLDFLLLSIVNILISYVTRLTNCTLMDTFGVLLWRFLDSNMGKTSRSLPLCPLQLQNQVSDPPNVCCL